MRSDTILISCVCALLLTGCRAQPEYGIIPHPTLVRQQSGLFRIDAGTSIAVSDPSNAELVRLVELLRRVIRDAGGPDVPIVGPDEPRTTSTIHFGLEGNPASDRDERYLLTVTERSSRFSAPQTVGLFYAIQTFSQLLPVSADDGEPLEIASVRIEDEPRFPYRGMHLDVGRHFFPVSFIKKYIDMIAMYKMNTFHWHLTEDQGWRIEIKKYPKLTEIGAYRTETMVEKNFDPYIGDGVRYGGYYTQDEIREVVDYALERYVTIVPEIEMPGHSSAAIAAYPELGCGDEPVAVATTWGVFEDIYCPKEETFAFLEDVLEEVIGLFPGKYIHIGGDEAPKKQWEESPVAQEVMRREGLENEDELQSYFVRRIEQFLLSKDRRLIGWDEILEGGLAPEATVMSWRGMTGGIEAAKKGHNVIMTPTSHCYFDYYQGDEAEEPLAIGGFIPLEKVYAFEPVPDELSVDEARHILGAQGNVWTEYMKTPSHVEYMAVPRMLALSEVVWSEADDRDWSRFSRALQRQLPRLDAKDINYRHPAGDRNAVAMAQTGSNNLSLGGAHAVLLGLRTNAHRPLAGL